MGQGLLILSPKKSVFNNCKTFYAKTGCGLIDFDVVYPMQSTEFAKSLNFGYFEQLQKKRNVFYFSLKNGFLCIKKYFFHLRYGIY